MKKSKKKEEKNVENCVENDVENQHSQHNSQHFFLLFSYFSSFDFSTILSINESNSRSLGDGGRSFNL